MRRVRWGLASVCAVGVSLLTAGCGGSRHARNAGVVWGSYGQNGGLIRGANVDGSGHHIVATDYGDSEGDPAWTRDGQAIAFYARNSDGVNIEIVWPKKKMQRAIYDDGRSPSPPRRTFGWIFNPTWAPDGDRLAVSDDWNGPRGSSTIRIVSVSTKRWTSVTKPDLRLSDAEPAWSPDGETIAFVRWHDESRAAIFLVAPDGHGLRRLTRGWSPSWSPGSRYIAFAWGGGIYRIGPDGRGRTRIVGGVDANEVSWSPDGRKLLYTTRNGDVFDVWMVNSDGTNRVRVVRKAYINGVAWQPG